MIATGETSLVVVRGRKGHNCPSTNVIQVSTCNAPHKEGKESAIVTVSPMTDVYLDSKTKHLSLRVSPCLPVFMFLALLIS